MNHAAKISTLPGQRRADMSIDWEFQPSLQHLVRRDDGAPTWAETMPVSLEAMHTPVTFREPLEGLSVRDLDEPEIFRVFFGEAGSPAARA